MRQFRVFVVGGGHLVLDLQSDLIDTASRVVAPLVPVTDDDPPLTRMEPIFTIDTVPHYLRTAELAALPQHLLSTPVADLSAHDYEIRNALDMVFSGF